MCSTMQIHCQTEFPYMVKQYNIYGQNVQLINHGQIWCQYWNAIQMLTYIALFDHIWAFRLTMYLHG